MQTKTGCLTNSETCAGVELLAWNLTNEAEQPSVKQS